MMADTKMPIKIYVISLIIIVSRSTTKIGKEESKQPAGRRRQKFLVLGVESLGAFRHAERQIVY